MRKANDQEKARALGNDLKKVDRHVFRRGTGTDRGNGGAHRPLSRRQADPSQAAGNSKQLITLRLDAAMHHWFQQSGAGTDAAGAPRPSPHLPIGLPMGSSRSSKECIPKRDLVATFAMPACRARGGLEEPIGRRPASEDVEGSASLIAPEVRFLGELTLTEAFATEQLACSRFVLYNGGALAFREAAAAGAYDTKATA